MRRITRKKNDVRVAIIYDYDGTLARGNIQEASFIPDQGMTKEDFWRDVKESAKKNDADEILTYMNYMIKVSEKNGNTLSKDSLRNHGKSSELFDGLAEGEWFSRINAFSKGKGISVEHYIVSSGLYEMIEGSPISRYFKHIFASRYVYDIEGKPEWPAVAINYTTKTQYIFRINKGILNDYDNDKINKYVNEVKRRIRFDNIIFVGDGSTDIPSMKMVSYKGGTAIAVYDPKLEDSDKKKIYTLLSEGRVNFVAEADYSDGKQIDILVKGIIGRISMKNNS